MYTKSEPWCKVWTLGDCVNAGSPTLTKVPIWYVSGVGGWVCVKNGGGPDWCGSVGWALSHKAESCWSKSQSGHMPACGFGPWIWVCMRGNLMGVSLSYPCFFPSFYLFFPLSKNKSFKKYFKNNVGGCAHVRAGVYGKSMYLLLDFTLNTKLPKIKSVIKTHTHTQT